MEDFLARIPDDPPGHRQQVADHLDHVAGLHGIDADTASKVALEMVSKCSAFMAGLTPLERDLLGFAMMATGPRG